MSLWWLLWPVVRKERVPVDLQARTQFRRGTGAYANEQAAYEWPHRTSAGPDREEGKDRGR